MHWLLALLGRFDIQDCEEMETQQSIHHNCRRSSVAGGTDGNTLPLNTANYSYFKT